MRNYGYGGHIGEPYLQLLSMVIVMTNQKRNTDIARKRRNDFLWFLCYAAVVVIFLKMVAV